MKQRIGIAAGIATALLLLLLPLSAQAQVDPWQALAAPIHNPMQPVDLTAYTGRTDVAVFGTRVSHGWVTAPIYDRSAPHYYFKRLSSVRLQFYKLTGVVNGVQQWTLLSTQLIGTPPGGTHTSWKRPRALNPLLTWYWWRFGGVEIVAYNSNPSNKIKVRCMGYVDVKTEISTPLTLSGWTYLDQSLAFAPYELQFPVVIQGGPPHGPQQGGSIIGSESGGNAVVQPEQIDMPWGTMQAVHDDTTGEVVGYYSVLVNPANPYMSGGEAAVDAFLAANPGFGTEVNLISSVPGSPTTPDTWQAPPPVVNVQGN